MSKKGIQRRKLPADGELTIHDFANAIFPRGKYRKSISTKIIKDQELVTSTVDNEIENCQQSLPNHRRRKCNNMEKEDPNHVYNDYHIDVWFLISEYVHPEDVGRFALICKKTDAVVASAKFWYSLYRKYFSTTVDLPQRLQPDCMVRLGLRAKVICSLFYTYLPFIKRLKLPPNLNILKQLECVFTWHKQEDKMWIFSYRFTNHVQTRKSPRVAKLESLKYDGKNEFDANDESFDEFLLQFNNIFDNSAEGHHLLVIFTKRFIPFPKFHGQKAFLNSNKQPISQNLRNFNLELTFANYRDEFLTTVKYENVLKLRVISWWHPDYNLFSSL